MLNHYKFASSYYFKYGIATPMLKSKKVRACLMEDSVFDQSIVGIFPKKIIRFTIYFSIA
ncbi:hypothetical protein U5S90_10615 [Streptococcus agalactiae]|uniref:hypothetical protein n=1 Tax=Streptococcus agalactiae TaxID=1311 RepID=UPI00137529A3|nr:hypothetical protein [Streptococcus agalactiae]KAF1126175.1 hypothetical protein B8U92_08465 [Streptococcus agalactiae]MCD0020469.1 hypothetical protein [Streptococcus agalactiae]